MTDEEIPEEYRRLWARLLRVYGAVAILMSIRFALDYVSGGDRTNPWLYTLAIVVTIAMAVMMLIGGWQICVTHTVLRWHSSRNVRERLGRDREERAARKRAGLAEVRDALSRFMAGGELLPLWRTIVEARWRDDLSPKDRAWLEDVYGLAYMAQVSAPTGKERDLGLIGPEDLRREIRLRSL